MRTFRTDGVWGVYPIVDRAARVRWLLDQGVRTIQIRVKDLEGQALRDELAAAVEAGEPHDAQIVVNDFWSLALELGAPWVHLGQDDLDDADTAAIRAAGVGLGVSTHDMAELARGLAVQPDYVALGPIYETTLKAMPFGPQGLARITDWKARFDVPLVAIGGMTLERAPGALEAGADAVSFVSDIQRDDAEARVRAWLDLFSR